jgi:hypothetical protein
MKKILILFLLITTAGVAQNDSLELSTTTKAVHLREVPRHNLVVDFGIIQPSGNFKDIARTGLNIGAEYVYYTNKHLGLGVSVRHQYNEFGYLDFQNDAQTTASQNNYSNTSIAIGPTYSFTKNRFQMDLFAKAGVALLKNPDNRITEVGIGNTLVFSSDAANDSSSSAYIEGGLRFNYYFRRSVQVFFSPVYGTTLGKPLAYSIRDDSSTAPIRPNVLKTINVSNLMFNIGIKIALTKEYSNGENRYDGD